MSGGADATVRIWDIKSQTLMASVYVVKPVRSVVWWCKKDPITGSNCKVPPTPLIRCSGPHHRLQLQGASHSAYTM
jgi:hypothetical protein